MMKNVFNRLILCVFAALWASALSAQAHWTCDINAYQYDMTIYFMLNDGEDNVSVDDLSNYEVAAFVGDECRGVGEFITATGTNGGQSVTYGYLRVRSNSASGETVTFKAYNKTTEEELAITTESTVSFASQASSGFPSSPIIFTLTEEAQVTMGDVDGDGRITINDAILTISATFGEEPDGFISAAADMDEDGRITINDVILIINKTF